MLKPTFLLSLQTASSLPSERLITPNSNSNSDQEKMAELVVGPAIEVVLEHVISLAADPVGMYYGFNDELELLRDSAEMIKAFLADAEAKQGKTKSVELWLKQLEAIAFEADHVFDELNYQNLRRQVKSQSNQQQQQQLLKGKGKGKVCFFFSFSCTQFAFRWRMASKIRDINTKLNKINEKATKYGLSNRIQIEAPRSVPSTAVATTSRQMDSIVVPNVVGRVEDESKIVDMLLRSSDKVVSVIPIFGMPGLGKTTLAKSVYNNPQVNEHFGEKGKEGKKVWVCVGKKINDIVELFKLISESSSGAKVELDNREVIVQKIKSELEEKRFFLVLDDVWNEEESLWDNFFNTLKGLKPTNGSWCLVTTRQIGVANAMPGHLGIPYKLQNLTDDDCWSIIERKVATTVEIPKEMKKQILKRCGGLPLAAILFGSLLAKGKEKWRSIVQESLLDGHQNNGYQGVKQVIKVSFDHLSPAAVKKCFAYCSMFPQDTEMKKDLLIELWMAEGFLQPDPKNERLMMEDIGDVYFRILLQSSLLEEVEEWGETHYKMHDLVHDFAKSALNEDRYLASESSRGIPEYVTKKNSTSLRTLFLESSISGDVLSKLECLHVLNFSGADVEELPASIGKLIHLRFLDISDSQITKLPKSLCKLYNLQTLRIQDVKLEGGLPKQMSNLICLRHLHYYDDRAEFQMPSEMGQLIHLQTLMFFNVGREDGRRIEELGNLKDLKGSLEIRNLELVNGKEGAEQAKLFEKSNLSELTFLWSEGVREGDNRDEDVLEGLQPHPNLQKLEIRSFMGDQFPGWFINLSTLVRLEFNNCEKCRELPALGQLPFLERLKLNGLKNMRSIGFSFYGVSSGSGQVRKCFPCLKYLLLENMKNLEEWRDEDEVGSTTGAVEVNLFPVLEILLIQGCPRLISVPRHFPSIEEIRIRNTVTESHGDEHEKSMSLRKRGHINNSEGDVEYDFYATGCGSVDGEMLERLCHLPGIRHLELRNFSNQRLIVYECDGWTSLLGKILKSCISLQILIISHCEGFTSLPGEMLQSCSSLQDLRILGCNGLTSLPSEMLQSCSSLQNLYILDCNGLTSLPSEMLQSFSLQNLEINSCSGLTDLPGEMLQSCSSLQNLEINSCNGLTSLPGEMLQSCSSLQNLKIISCSGLTSLPGEMLQSCSSLQNLKIHYCNGLTSLPGKMLQSCSSLQNLKIWYCNGLTSLPGEMLQSCSSLQNLEISYCNGLTSLPGEMLQSCFSLQNLEISYCNGLTSLAGEMLQSCASLKGLRVYDCPNLVYFPHNLRQTPSLEILDLSNCPKLVIADMPKGFAFLTSLRRLKIGPFSICQTNEEFDWSALTTSSSSSTLTYLGFFGLPHVESLPEQLRYFTSLTDLFLEGFGIEALPDWTGNLGSVERLELWSCGKLRCLPSVAVRRRLTKLTSLKIFDCPLLEERYNGDTNSQWPIRSPWDC